MNKKLIIPLFLIALLLSSCAFTYNGQEPVIKENWGITIPSGGRELYYGMLESVFGDGPRYTVLEYSNNEKLENAFEWGEADESDIEEITEDLEFLNENTDEKIPKKLIPDFSKLPMWKTAKDEGNDFIWIFYDENKSRLYIAEYFL